MTIQIESQEVISSLELIERIDELSWLEEDELTNEFKIELKELEDIADECSGGDWSQGLSFINSYYFTAYIEEMLIDLGMIPKDLSWAIVIDWEATANRHMDDYSTIKLNGETYFYLSC